MVSVHDYFANLRNAVHRARNEKALRKLDKFARSFIRKIPSESREMKRKAYRELQTLRRMIQTKKQMLAY